MQRMLILLVFVCAFEAQAQVKSQLFLDGALYDQRVFLDTLSLTNHLQKMQLRWINQGFYFSGIDSTTQKDDSTFFYLYKGARLKATLTNYKGKKLQVYLEKKLQEYANNGYPFASISLDSVSVNEGRLSAKVVVQSGPEIAYDSAYFFNEIKTNHSYIYQLLDIVPEDDFSERSYRQVSRKIQRSPYLSLQRPTDLSFKNKKAKIFLDIKEEDASSFQGVLGLQQNATGKSAAVGSIELDLQNLFRSGKQFTFSWESFAEQSQRLNVFYKHPFFLDSKIAPSFRFDLLKQDTTFLTRRLGVGIHTYIAPRVELSMMYEQNKGTLLSSNLNVLEQSGLAGYTRATYSVQFAQGDVFTLGKLREGIVWRTLMMAGRKDVDRNLNVPDSYYDSLEPRTNFYQFEFEIAYQLKTLKRQAFFHHMSTGITQNDQLLRNELYRIGGLASLRGFNEISIFARHYFLSRAEFRSFFEEESYAYLFYDQMIYQQGSLNDNPYGIGLGFALATSAGQFSFAIGVGNSKNQSISFSTMKVHFGYISRF